MTQQDRLQAYIAELVAVALERAILQGDALVYFTEWLYQVETVHPGSPVTYDLRSTDPRLPDLEKIALWPGPSGASAEAKQGSQVRVRFANADRTKPMIVGLDPNAVDKVIAPADVSMLLAGGANPLIPSPWATDPTFGLIKVLGTLASALTTGGITNTLAADLATLPSADTTKVKAT